jgi:hypothetical protein
MFMDSSEYGGREYENDGQDEEDEPARGCFYGLMIALGMWALIAAVCYLAVRYG